MSRESLAMGIICCGATDEHGATSEKDTARQLICDADGGISPAEPKEGPSTPLPQIQQHPSRCLQGQEIPPQNLQANSNAPKTTSKTQKHKKTKR